VFLTGKIRRSFLAMERTNMAGPDSDTGWDQPVAEPGVATIDRLYADHSAWLGRLVRQRFRVSSAEADDIVQDTYFRALRAPAGLIQHPRAFLSRIAANLFRDQRRREAVRAEHRREVAAADGDRQAFDAITEQEMAVELERLVLSLPDLYRDPFVLSRFGRMTNRDIADHLGLSVKTVEWRIGRAIELCMHGLRS
jgi:RNA polymerase sigma factor (sigma-70 family)